MKNFYKIFIGLVITFVPAYLVYALVFVPLAPPNAIISSPATSVSVPQNQTVSFSGYGTSAGCTSTALGVCKPAPSITGYEWRENSCVSGGLLSNSASFILSNPTIGTRTIFFRAQDANGWSTNCPSRVVTVTSPVGTVSVSTNISATWTITGPSTIFGSGTSQSYPSKPTGTYTVTWGAVFGHNSPASQSFTLGSGGVINFSGTYAAVTINSAPSVTTPTHTGVTANSVILGATVTSLGTPAVISARGTCWATTPNPTTNCVPEGGQTTGAFSHTRTGMTGGTTYYYRGYAVNSTGIGYSSDSSFTAPLASCPAPWGGSIASGSSVSAYQFSSVSAPATCSAVSETRTCNNGTLSGSYTNQSCSVSTSCTTPWGTTLSNGSSVPAYQSSTVTAPATCSSVTETRTCSNGTLSGSYINQNCAVVNKSKKFWQF